MKYKLLTGLIIIVLGAKANLPFRDDSPVKLSGWITNHKINPTGVSESICRHSKSDNDSTAAKELKRLSKLWMEAMLHHDSTQLYELMAPEYKLQRWDGNLSAYRTAWLDNLFNYIKITHFEQTNMVAQVYGDVAIVTSNYDWAGTFRDKTFDAKGYLTDVWVRNNNHWQVISRTSGAFEGSKPLSAK